MTEPMLLHDLSVDDRSIAAFQIANPEARTLPLNHTVLPRHRGVTDGKSVGGIPAHRDLARGECEGRILQRARYCHESGVHHFPNSCRLCLTYQSRSEQF